MIAKVTIDIPHHAVDKSFDYRVPKECSEVQIGTRVEVHFNHKKHLGIITGFKKTSTQKNLKALLKIIDEKPLINEKTLKLAETLRTYYAMPLFDYLNLMIPAPLKKPLKTKKTTHPIKMQSSPINHTTHHEITPDISRLEVSLNMHSKAVLKNDFNTHETLFQFLTTQNNQKILIIHPNILSAELFYEKAKMHFAHGFLYHSKLKISEKRKSLQALKHSDVIMIGTKVALFIEPDKWDLVIINYADSSFYQHLERPRYDTLNVIELIHQTFQTKIIYVADTLPLSVLKDRDELHLKPINENDALKKSPLKIIPLATHALSHASLIVDETLNIIHDYLRHHKKVMVIHERKENQTGLESSDTLGIESLLEELKEFEPSLITSDTSQPLEVFRAFQETGQILIGTSMLLNIDEVTHLGAIVFIKWDDFTHDSTQGDLNSYNALIKASHLLHKTSGEIIVQTYQEHHPVLTAFNDSTLDFGAQELEKAKQLNLPPFSDMVQIILESESQKDLAFYSKSALNYLKKALRDHAQILGPRFNQHRSIITVKSDDLNPYRSSLRSLIHAFNDDIKIELRTHQFII